MKEKINWGILGCGRIAESFARDLQILPDANILAVASKSGERAEKLAGKFSIERMYTNYEELAANPRIDVIYVATTHNDHYQNASLCLEHGKAVLVEKPFCVNAGETKKLIRLARVQGVFLMEAMWTRYLPAIRSVRERILSGQFGKVKMIFADFGFCAPFDPESRVFNPDLAGGALMDVGIYPVSFAYMIFGRKPDSVTSQAVIGKTGIDEESSYLFKYNNESLAVLSSSVVAETIQNAAIICEKGNIVIPQFWRSRKAIVTRAGKPAETIEPAFKGKGYNYEASEVMECLRHGKTESEIMPLDESLEIMQTMDLIRSQIGLTYPFEMNKVHEVDE